jgi:hypothetical protein
MAKKNIYLSVGLFSLLLALILIGAFIFGLNSNAPAFRDISTKMDDVLFSVAFLFALTIWAAFIIYRIQDHAQIEIFFALTVFSLLLLLFGLLMRIGYSAVFYQYMWYCTYLPMLVIPTLWVSLVLLIFTKRNVKKILLISGSCSLLLFLMVITNDLHHFVFSFNENGRYTREFGYYLIYGFIILSLLFSLAVVNYMTFRMNTFKDALPVWIAAAVIIALSVCYLVPETHAFIDRIPLIHIYYLTYPLFEFLIFEVALRSGLVQNTGFYKKYFEKSSLRLALTDAAYRPIYLNENFKAVAEIEHADSCLVNGLRCRKEKKADGYLLIEEDLTSLLALQRELLETQKNLKATTEMLKKRQEIELTLAKKRFQEELTQTVDAEIGKENDEINSILASLPDELTAETRTKYLPLLSSLKIRICFLKQRCLFLINGSSHGRLSFDEFSLSMGSLLQDLRGLDFSTACTFKANQGGSLAFGLAVNSFLHGIIAGFKDERGALLINLNLKEGFCKVRVSRSKHFTLTKIEVPFTKVVEDGEYLLTLGEKK